MTISLTGAYPRYRLYTDAYSYFGILPDIILGRLLNGDSVSHLEAELGKFLDTENVVCTSMCRMGIYYAVKALIKPGQRVIMSPYTIADVVNMVICAGGAPVRRCGREQL